MDLHLFQTSASAYSRAYLEDPATKAQYENFIFRLSRYFTQLAPATIMTYEQAVREHVFL